MSSLILKILRQAIALLLVYAVPVATCPLEASGSGQQPQAQAQWTNATPEASSPKIPGEQLDSLVAPIALYPDPLLAQVLVASTYPLEVIQLQQWLDRNKDLKDQALVDAVQKQNWDASIEALAALPDVVKILSENIKWTTELGDAFLAQQNDVMDAVQRMRAKAKNAGQLKSSEQQKVETKVIEDKTVVVIEPSKPDVIYVPSYDPMVVYGAPAYAYPYPPMYYPPGYYAAGMALSFGVGMAMGAAWGGCCGWGCGWGGSNNVFINNNNNFVNRYNNNQNLKNANFNRPSQQPARGNSNWQHNPEHRGGTPYGNRDVANKFGGTSRGDSLGNRQASARRNQGMQQAGMRDRGAGGMDRGDRGGIGNTDRGGGFGGDRAGSRDVSRGSGSGAFGGASSGMSDRGARASQSRGASSMSSRSGGFSGGGGGGGRRGGGGGGGRRR